MTCLYAAGLLVALAAAPAGAATSFADCAAKTGPEYRKARDQFLALPADQTKPLLEQKLDSDAWQDRLTARILLGWQENGAEYRQLLQAPKVVNQKGDAHYPWSLPPSAVKERDAPLMMELLTKDGDADGAWDAARALAGLVGEKPDAPIDSRLLHDFLRDGASPAAARAATAFLIGALPAKDQDADELSRSLKEELARKDKSRGIVESLLAGFARAAEKMPADKTNRVVQDLLATAGLQDLLGKELLIHALGDVGGDAASQLVARHLDQTPDEVEKSWAMRTLGRSNSVVGANLLVRYVDDKTLPPGVHEAAIEGLGLARYTPKVGEKLQEIAMSAKSQDVDKLLAVHSLHTISAGAPRTPTSAKTLSRGSRRSAPPPPKATS